MDAYFRPLKTWIMKSPTIYFSCFLIMVNLLAASPANGYRGEDPLNSREEEGERLMRYCPASGMGSQYSNFFSSWCTEELGPRAFEIACTNPTGRWTRRVSRGLCLGNEICAMVRPSRPPNLRTVASCIQFDSQYTILEASDGNTVRRQQHQLSLDRERPRVDSSFRLAVVMTRLYHHSILFQVPKIRVAPTTLAHELVGPAVSCTDCTTLRVSGASTWTQTFDMNITLPKIHNMAGVQVFVWNEH